jgi:zinc transport system substrate-binding protein
VASIYPLAFAAERMAPPEWEVLDLTPPGVEAHDLELTLEQRAAIEDADYVLYLGDIGFQPQVEQAVKEAEGRVLDLSPDLDVEGGVADPHIWLHPERFETIVGMTVQDVICPFEDPCDSEDHARVEAFERELDALGLSYYRGLQGCRYETMVVTHEAFGYLYDLYGLKQFGLAGVTPEAEPSAERLEAAQQLIESGQAGAVFYEDHEDAQRIAESFAADSGVSALSLNTLESQPASGDYFTMMEDNLESLREGLQCQ